MFISYNCRDEGAGHTDLLSGYMNSLNLFAEATLLIKQVTISIYSDLPAAIEYKEADMGHIRFYMAPKIEELA